MKKIFFVACAAAALTFASCGSKNASTEQANDAAQATEQAAEAAAAPAEEAAQAVVNEVFVALQNKMNDFLAKVEASKKADLPALTDELKALKAEFEAATLSEDETNTLKALSEKIVEALKNLN